MRYDYYENVKEDVKEYILENYEKDELEGLDTNKLYDDLWADDYVTGNGGSNSYYCNAWKAEEAICHNLDLAQEAYEMFGYDGIPFKDGAEAIDVTIRCYVLGQVLNDALDELKGDE